MKFFYVINNLCLMIRQNEMKTLKPFYFCYISSFYTNLNCYNLINKHTFITNFCISFGFTFRINTLKMYRNFINCIDTLYKKKRHFIYLHYLFLFQLDNFSFFFY